MNIAVVSPNKPQYSETFIAVHKNLNGTVHMLSGGGYSIPLCSDVSGDIYRESFLDKLKFKLPFFNIKGQQVLQKSFEQYLRSNQIQVVLAEYGPVGVGLVETCKKLQIPLVVHFHGFDAYMHNTLAEYKLAYKTMFDYASAIIVVSKHMQQVLVNKLGARASKVFYNTYGPHPSFFSIQPNFDNHNYVFVGRFTDKKAPYLLLLAFHEVAKQNSKAKLIMIGDGLLLSSAKVIAQALHLEKQVEFRGAVSREEIQQCLSNCRAYVQHSIVAEDGDCEGTPNAVLEASASGLPVISSRHTGIVDVVKHEETGYLVEEKDVANFTAYWIALDKDKSTCETMGRKGRQFIMDSFTQERCLSELNRIIEKVVV
jgi:colanic acid/amylovoran biosynthesis glycosyltransferase